MTVSAVPAAAGRGGSVLPWVLPVQAIRLHLVTMPVLSGLDRGLVVPFLRPSEVVQLLVMAIVVAGVVSRCAGRSWPVRLHPLDRTVIAMAVLSFVVPILWMTARGLSVTLEDLLAAMPFVKYAALYVAVRLAVTTRDDVRQVLSAIVVAGAFLASVSIAQMFVPGVGEALAGSFGDSQVGFTTGGRGTTTLASAIATFGVLIQVAGLCTAAWLTSGRRIFGVTSVLVILGTVLTGQISGLIGLGIVLVYVVLATGTWRTARPYVLYGAPVVLLALVPVMRARLDGVVAGTLLPTSWVTRLDNLGYYYLPELLPFNWVLGVRPDAVLVPLDTWRDEIFLESGYLWLTWVGGLPLLLAFLVLLWRARDAAHRLQPDADPVLATVGYGFGASVLAVAVLSVIDPHVTMRGVADVFFVSAALAMVRNPLIDESAPARQRRGGTRERRLASPDAYHRQMLLHRADG